jgi:hypothetical protein
VTSTSPHADLFTKTSRLVSEQDIDHPEMRRLIIEYNTKVSRLYQENKERLNLAPLQLLPVPEVGNLAILSLAHTIFV